MNRFQDFQIRKKAAGFKRILSGWLTEDQASTLKKAENILKVDGKDSKKLTAIINKFGSKSE